METTLDYEDIVFITLPACWISSTDYMQPRLVRFGVTPQNLFLLGPLLSSSVKFWPLTHIPLLLICHYQYTCTVSLHSSSAYFISSTIAFYFISSTIAFYFISSTIAFSPGLIFTAVVTCLSWRRTLVSYPFLLSFIWALCTFSSRFFSFLFSRLVVIMSACFSCDLRYTCFFLFSVIWYITVHFSMLSLFKCLCWLSQFFSFDLVIFVAGYLLMFLEWMSGLLVVAGLGPIRWDSTSTDLFIGSSVLFMPFCLHSYFTCIVLQRQLFSHLSFSGFFFNYILPWVSHVHTVHRVYISCNVLFYFLLIPISLISLL